MPDQHPYDIAIDTLISIAQRGATEQVRVEAARDLLTWGPSSPDAPAPEPAADAAEQEGQDA